MHPPAVHEFGNSEAPEVSADDLAFISQFAEVTEKPLFESAHISHSGGEGRNRPIAPLPRKAINSALAGPRSHIGEEDTDSEDEVEGVWTGPTYGPKASTTKAKHIVK